MDMRARRRPARCAVGGRARAGAFPNARARAARHSTTAVAMPPKETVLDLARFIDRGVRVKLSGGREVTGTLKGYDQLLNLVLDEAIEHLQGRGGRAEDLGRDQGARAVGVQRDERDGGVGAGLDGGDREPVLGGGRGGDLIARGTNAGAGISWVQS